MIASNGFCDHVDGGGYPSYCRDTSVYPIKRCKENCTNKTSCVGFSYYDRSGLCILFPTDGTCPDGFIFYSKSNTAETVNDLVAYNYSGFVCYGKNSGNYKLLFEK